MGGIFFLFLVLILWISNLSGWSNSIPITTRINSDVMPGNHVPPINFEETHMASPIVYAYSEAGGGTHTEDWIDGSSKMVEVNDYPGSGANNRHTPRPQFGRCVDC